MTRQSPSVDPAVERMRNLLRRWHTSLDLHLKYLTLDDAHYWHVQPWPRHERPAAWIVKLAHERVALLRKLLDAQLARGDTQLAEVLEHMAFLANLVGLQPGERHIPLADPDNEHQEALGPAPAARRSHRTGSQARMATPPVSAPVEATREMPRPRVARSTRSTGAERAADTARSGNTTMNATAHAGLRERIVIDDAIRLLQWGRQWHELGELISRMAERPGITEVRRTLRSHRAAIEAAAARPAR